MSKPLIVIADSDENYLAALEYKFLETLSEKIELEIISDSKYFEDFFSAPKTAEIVVVDEKMYTRDLHKHNISNLFVLTEEIENGNTAELTVTNVFKYSGIKEIYNELIYRSKDRLFEDVKEHKATQVIAMYSAVGGSGKTCLSLGLAECLVLNHQKVLYINTESIQGFAFYLQDKSAMPNNGYRAIRDDETHVYGNVRHFIKREGFYYLPPFTATLDSLNLDYAIYENLIAGAKESREFDFIIVDIEAGYDELRMELLQKADKVFMVTQQDAYSLFKTELILKNIDLQDREKYLFICNKYRENEENAYLNSQIQKVYPINEYVEYIETQIESIRQLSQLNSIQKLAYMFI